MKTINIRVEERLLDEVTKGGANPINSSVVEALQDSAMLRKMSSMEIKGIFSAEEWSAMASATNGLMIENAMLTNKELALAEFEDAEIYNNTFSQFGADFSITAEKIKKLTFAQYYAMVKRIKDYWDADVQPNLSTWTKF